LKPGIRNSVLVSQVRNTAPWLFELREAAELAALFTAAADESEGESEASLRALRLRLAAHYATVATFVPTDVDAQIRHHHWVAISDAEAFAVAQALVTEAAARDAALVSRRVTEGISGHDGEWLAVRAGALGRALVLGLQRESAGLAEAIDAELEREARTFEDALDRGAPAEIVLALATTLAHNLGDLSRVVEAWPRAALERGFERYVRLGHDDGAEARASFVLAGRLNKELMALENHRFLALRKPRALRRSRELLLPVGPWFDAWGEGLVASPHMGDADRAEVVAALVEVHLRSPEQQGCLRALAGLHRATRGGLAVYADALPARSRKHLARGAIRDAIDLPADHFAARMEKRLRTALARWTPP
jgi:hypothetical protein